MKVDHLRPNEVLPGDFPMPKPDPKWIWVVRDNFDIITAYVIAVHGHGIVTVIRLHKVGDAPPLWATMLLRAAAEECVGRGFPVYLFWGDPENDGLVDLCKELGANIVPMNGAIVSGLTSKFSGLKERRLSLQQ